MDNGRREPGTSGERARKPITMSDFFTKTINADTKDTKNTTTTTNNNNNNNIIPSPPPTLPYSVRATKKGNVPCVVESRKHHKVVVLSNIEGDVDALLSVLRKKMGTGGVRKGNAIEISGGGDKQLETIKRFCVESGCVVGASKQTKGAVSEAALKGKTNKNKKANENETAKPKAATNIDPTIILTPKEIKTMKPTRMKEHLAARQLSTQGNKKELIARLISAAASSAT